MVDFMNSMKKRILAVFWHHCTSSDSVPVPQVNVPHIPNMDSASAISGALPSHAPMTPCSVLMAIVTPSLPLYGSTMLTSMAWDPIPYSTA